MKYKAFLESVYEQTKQHLQEYKDFQKSKKAFFMFTNIFSRLRIHYSFYKPAVYGCKFMKLKSTLRKSLLLEILKPQVHFGTLTIA